ncbi:MAG: hypothetical protein ABW298_11380 [Candidatus Binatia bacterium]
MSAQNAAKSVLITGCSTGTGYATARRRADPSRRACAMARRPARVAA